MYIAFTLKREIMIKDIQHQSSTLKESITIKAVFPATAGIERVLVLLHGKLEPEGDYSIIDKMSQELELESLAEKYKMAIVIPCMRNCYYISTEDYNISLFFSVELNNVINEHIFVEPNVELMIGGISMGGYGSILCAALSGAFDKIITISSAFIQDDIILGNNEIWAGLLPNVIATRGTYLQYFLPLHNFWQDYRKNVVAALSLFHSRQQKPFVIMTCGTDDWLYSRNKKFADILKRQNIPCVFLIIDGNHDGPCFREGLRKAMELVNSIND